MVVEAPHVPSRFDRDKYALLPLVLVEHTCLDQTYTWHLIMVMSLGQLGCHFSGYYV